MGEGRARRGQGYFTAQNQADRNRTPTKPLLNFHNWLKRSLYDLVLPSHSNCKLLELAAGRGGDLWKACPHNPAVLVLSDLDASALQEAERRWQGRRPNQAPRSQMRTVQADMRQPQQPGHFRQHNLPRGGTFDVVSCQMALHYFFETETSFGAFHAALLDSLRVGGRFMATFFNGERVRALLRQSGGHWECRAGRPPKSVLRLTRKWTAAPAGQPLASPFGQQVLVFLDTIGEHPEFVVDVDWLIRKLQPQFELEHRIASFGDKYADWTAARDNNSMPEQMRPFSFLYGAVVFRRTQQ